MVLTLPNTESFDDNTICVPELPLVLPYPYFKALYDFEDKVDVGHIATYLEPRGNTEISFDVYVNLYDNSKPMPITAMNLITAEDGSKVFSYIAVIYL